MAFANFCLITLHIAMQGAMLVFYGLLSWFRVPYGSYLAIATR
jgi:hypothetical protein